MNKVNRSEHSWSFFRLMVNNQEAGEMGWFQIGKAINPKYWSIFKLTKIQRLVVYRVLSPHVGHLYYTPVPQDSWTFSAGDVEEPEVMMDWRKAVSSGLGGTTAAVVTCTKSSGAVFQGWEARASLIVEKLPTWGGFRGKESAFSKGVASGYQAFVNPTPGI